MTQRRKESRSGGDDGAAVIKARSVQAHIDARSNAKGEEESAKAVQAGMRKYPEHYPPQHQAKPGSEALLDPRPLYQAPGYKGSEKLKGMAAIVTGADSGIGRAVAVLFAREGADIAVVYLNEHDDAEETKHAVEKEGRRCMLLSGDVSKPAFCASVVQQVVDAFGKLDILVNNAAFQEHATDITQITDEHFDLTLKTNLYGYFHMARAAVPRMKRGGSIVMTGSVTGIQGSKNLLDYAMTKGGIHAFARSLAAQLAEQGIRVNVIAPGPVWTPLNPADRPADDVTRFGSDTLMKRAAQPEEIAPAFVFMAAPSCASYITGEILPIIGGYGD